VEGKLAAKDFVRSSGKLSQAVKLSVQVGQVECSGQVECLALSTTDVVVYIIQSFRTKTHATVKGASFRAKLEGAVCAC
jgi:hypothetical protein